MRFAEFKVLLEAEETRNVYAVGDSHADAGGIASYKGVINRAQGGQPSTTQYNYNGRHKSTGEPTGIENIPPNQIVIISQGANDTANSMRAFMDSQGKTKLVPPATIAGNVAKLVNAAKSKGHIVVFVLFPNGPGRGSGLAKYYGGDYQEEVRNAIKAAVGVPVVDLDGRGLSPDGIHSTRGAYMSAAKEAIDIARKQPGGAVNQSGKVAEPGALSKAVQGVKDFFTGEFKVSVPPSNRDPAIADAQKALLALGYPLPKYGVDGIKMRETTGAVQKFQQDNNISPTGMLDDKTVAKLNELVKSKGVKLEKSTWKDVKGGKGSAGTRGMGFGGGKLPPLSTDAVTTGKIGQILNFLARYESAGDYNVILDGHRLPLTTMTIEEIYGVQADMKRRRQRSDAVGRYQYTGPTLRWAVQGMGLDPKKTKFDEKTQDEIAIWDMRQRCGLDAWLAGKLDDGKFLNALAQVWAAIPKTTGLSAYHGDSAGNKAGTTTDIALNTLRNIRTG